MDSGDVCAACKCPLCYWNEPWQWLGWWFLCCLCFITVKTKQNSKIKHKCSCTDQMEPGLSAGHTGPFITWPKEPPQPTFFPSESAQGSTARHALPGSLDSAASDLLTKKLNVTLTKQQQYNSHFEHFSYAKHCSRYFYLHDSIKSLEHS